MTPGRLSRVGASRLCLKHTWTLERTVRKAEAGSPSPHPACTAPKVSVTPGKHTSAHTHCVTHEGRSHEHPVYAKSSLSAMWKIVSKIHKLYLGN